MTRTHTMPSPPDATRPGALAKVPRGINRLDEVTGGGLPQGWSTLVCGPAGCGTTLVAMEFVVRGITQFDERGVVVGFEESADDPIAHVASLGFDRARSQADGMLVIDHVTVVRAEPAETGEWDLDDLLLRLGSGTRDEIEIVDLIPVRPG